jgi:hypothetical protein
MKPSPAKPTSIIAQVEGSGTAPPRAKTPLPSIVRSIGPEMKPRLIRLLSPAFLEGDVGAVDDDAKLGSRLFD